MDGIRNARDAQNPLSNRESSSRKPKVGKGPTSVEPGNMPSLAFNRAPLASWISLIFEPPLPITEPMREFGIINLIVTARLPGTDGLSKGSSLIRRTMRPNAWLKVHQKNPVCSREQEPTLDTASSGPLTFRMRSGFPGMLSDTITRALLLSLISFTCVPFLPMIIEASCVTMRHLMWM